MNLPPEPRPFRFSLLLINAALVLPAAFLYSVKTDSPVYFLIASAILLFAFFRKKYLPVRDRPIIYSITAVLILTIFPDMLITIDDSRAGIFDLLIRSNLIIPLMTYLAAFSCAFYPYPLRRGITAVCVVFALVICGDRFNSAGLNNGTLFFLDPVLHHYALAYGIAAAWTALVIPLYFIFPGRREKNGNSFSMKLRPVLLFLMLLLLPLFALAAEHFYYRNDSLMRAVEYHLLRISMRRHFGRPGSGYYRLAGRTSLTRSFPHDPVRSREVLMRVKAPFIPGYLRTATYCGYRWGHWGNPKSLADPVPLPASRPTGLISYSTFSVPDRGPKDAAERKMMLYFVRLNPGSRVPAPGSVTALEAVADSGAVSENGLLDLKHWRLDGGCTLILPGADRDPAWQGPSDPLKRPEFLYVPHRLRTELKRIASELKISGVRKEVVLPRLMQHFESFTYSLEHDNAGRNMDPVLYFLRKSRTGHCEFFASAAVLLLRSAGIPARYVTGFLCEEKNPVGDHYVVRAAHAHAWCEAYLPDRGQWVTVDPAAGYARAAFRTGLRQNLFSAWLDAAQQIFQQAFADIRRGHFAQAVMDLMTGLAVILWRIVSSVPGMIAIAVISCLLVFRLVRKRRRRLAGGYVLTDIRKKLVRIFERFERSCRRTTGKKRPDHMAILEFYREPELQEFCRTYERLRYGISEPSPQEIRDFAAEAARIGALMRKSASRIRQDRDPHAGAGPATTAGRPSGNGPC